MNTIKLAYTPFGVGLNLTSFGKEKRNLAVDVFTGWFVICSAVDTITDIWWIFIKKI